MMVLRPPLANMRPHLPGVVGVRYTLWSHGQLVGDSEMTFYRAQPEVCQGDLVPREGAAAIIAIATAVPAAARALAGAARNVASGQGRGRERLAEYAHMMIAMAQRDALALELRDENGRTVPTDWIELRDMDMSEELLELENDTDSIEDSPELAAAIQHDLALIEKWFGNRDESNSFDMTPDFDPDAEDDDDEPMGPGDAWRGQPETRWYHLTAMMLGGDERAQKERDREAGLSSEEE